MSPTIDNYMAEIEKEVSYLANSPSSKQRICMQKMAEKLLRTIENSNIPPNKVREYFIYDSPL